MNDESPAKLSLAELSSASGETAETLRFWRSLGLIGSTGEDPAGEERFTREDLERVRLVQFCLRRGFGAEAIARAERKQGSFRRYLDFQFPGGVGPTRPLSDAAGLVGLDLEQARRLSEACGMSEPIDEPDLKNLRGAKQALDAGLPEEALLQLLRVHAESLGRVAEADVRLFHFYVHERLKGAGLSGDDVLRTTRTASARLAPMIEPMALYFLRKGMRKALREDLVMHLAEDAGLSARTDAPAQLRLAIVFVDLSSFTPLAEAMGDVAAAQVVERFSGLVREAARRWEGRIVDRIGDAFLLVFPEPRWAVACALEIEQSAAAEPQFPAVRGGVHCGPVLYREGGYVGSNLNLAARVAAEADRHQTLVTAAVCDEAVGLAGVEFVHVGKRSLKGVSADMELFEARSAAAGRERKIVDPVCEMEMAPAEVAATLSLEGKERGFCSERCLRAFVTFPEP